MSDLNMRIEIVGGESASGPIRRVETSLAELERQAKRTGSEIKAAFARDALRALVGLKDGAEAFGTVMTEAATKSTKALKAETAAAVELRDALREAAEAHARIGAAPRAARTAAASSGSSDVRAAQNEASARARAYTSDIRAIRQRLRVLEASQRAERREIEDTGNAWAAAQRRKMSMIDQSALIEARRQPEADRAEAAASRQRMRDIASTWKIRERSEKAERDHAAAIRRERDGTRTRAVRSGQRAFHHARHAASRINHPVLSSPGFWLQAGAAFGAEAGKKIIEGTVGLDTAAARYRMLAVPDGADAGAEIAKARTAALKDSITLGIPAAKVLDIQTKAIRDGIAPEIARTLPASIAAAAQTMGGDVERLTDSLAEGLQEAFSMKWLKSPEDARKFLNIEAGLSNYAGNSAEKSEQFIASGGLGHGKEMGLDLTDTMAYGAMLNASGARTGQASARFMGQLSQNTPKMTDKFMRALDSRSFNEEDRAVVAAPHDLGYGNVQTMQQKIMAGPEGLIDFATRLQVLDDKTRKLVLEGYGFSEQGGAMLAELGANGGAKGKAVLARAKELASQKAADDYLSSKFKEWSTGLAFMIQQIEAGWHAIETEIGDVMKSDLIAPFRDWWIQLSAAIVGGGLRDRVHESLLGFVHGLGFDDFRQLLDSMTASIRGFDIAGFAKGLGEGIRATIDAIRPLFGMFGHGAGDAETMGKFAAELFGLSVSLHAIGPVVSIVTAVSSGILALKAAVEGFGLISGLTGLTGAIKGLVGLDLLAGASGLMAFAGAIGAIAAAVQGLLSAGILPKVSLVPEDTTKEGLDKWAWGKNPDGTSARPAWVDRWFGTGNSDDKKPGDGLVKGPHGGLMPAPKGFKPTAYDGGGAQDWRFPMTPASYSPSDSDDTTRDAMLDTPRRVIEVREAIERLAEIMRASATRNGDDDDKATGFGGGGGEGGGNANLRYGRGAAGSFRSTPGTGSYGDPSKSLLDLIAKSEGAGYNVSWGNGKFLPGGHEQNLTGKSLNEILALGDTMRRQPNARNSSALGRYQITGSTLRDLMGRLHLNGSEKFDEAMQDRLASKLISDEGPRALNRWEGLKRGTYMAQAQGLLRSGSIASQPGDVSSNGGGGSAGGAVDKAMSMLGMGEGQSARELGKRMSPGEWCADFVNGALNSAGVKGTNSSMAASFSQWGHHVGGFVAQKGDVIEERHGNHVGHVGLATGNVQRDRAGNVTAVEMVSGNYGHMVKRNWEKVGIIADLRRADEAVTAAARSFKATVPHHDAVKDPEDIARKVVNGEGGKARRRDRPVPDAGTAPDIRADAGDARDGGGSTREIHHHHTLQFFSQVADADQHARSVGREMDRHMATRVHDVDHDVG